MKKLLCLSLSLLLSWSFVFSFASCSSNSNEENALFYLILDETTFKMTTNKNGNPLVIQEVEMEDLAPATSPLGIYHEYDSNGILSGVRVTKSDQSFDCQLHYGYDAVPYMATYDLYNIKIEFSFDKGGMMQSEICRFGSYTRNSYSGNSYTISNQKAHCFYFSDGKVTRTALMETDYDGDMSQRGYITNYEYSENIVEASVVPTTRPSEVLGFRFEYNKKQTRLEKCAEYEGGECEGSITYEYDSGGNVIDRKKEKY